MLQACSILDDLQGIVSDCFADFSEAVQSRFPWAPAGTGDHLKDTERGRVRCRTGMVSWHLGCLGWRQFWTHGYLWYVDDVTVSLCCVHTAIWGGGGGYDFFLEP